MPDPGLVTLVGAASLREVSFVELSARRNDIKSDGVQVFPSWSLGVKVQDEDEPHWLKIALRVEIDSEPGTIRAEAGASYEVSAEGAEALADQKTVVDFGNQVAVMTLIPYLRYGIADITMRIFGAPMLMPVIERGTLHFDVDTAEDEHA